MPVIMLVLI